MKVFRKFRPIFDTHHTHESQISRVAPSRFFCCIFFSSFIFLFFFLGKTDVYRKLLLSSFFAFPPFFRSGLTRCRGFSLLQRHRKQTIHVNWTFGSLTMEIKIMKNGFSKLWELKHSCFFFSSTKRIEKARCSSKSFTESLTRSSSIWYQVMTKILVNT